MNQFEDLLQQCTVKLTLPGKPGWGTGFFVAPRLILTCAHVVREANGRTVQVQWQNQANWAEAVVERSLANPYDLALLRVTPPVNTNPPCVYLDDSINSRDPLYLFGFPDEGDSQGEPRTFNCDGVTGSEVALILFNLGQVRPGMSGSPLLNQRTDKVCGIVKFTRDRSIDLGGGAIPTRVILEQFPELQELQRAFHQSDRRWSNFVSKSASIQFQNYLQSIVEDEGYREWQELYTPTSVEDRKYLPHQGTIGQRKVTPRLKLRVETVQPVKDGQKERRADEPEQREQVEQLGVLEGLRKYAVEHVLLVGKPGSGKTTSLERLLWEEADRALQTPDARIPVLVKLRRCTGTIEELIHDFFSQHQLPDLGLVDIKELLRQGKILLLLDGLNELPESLITEFINFRDRYRRTTPMIISTRELIERGMLGVEKTLKMLPLTELQMQEFIQGYLGNEGSRLFQQVKGDRLRKFAETPLLLWMLCRVFVQTGHVPINLGLSFREFTQIHDKDLQQDAPADSKDQWHKLLRYLAFSLMQAESVTDLRLSMPKEEAENLLTAYLQEDGRANARDCAERWLKDLLKYHLIQPIIQSNLEEHIEFRHQLIQEYYAAEYLLQIVNKLTDKQIKRDYLNYLKWTEPIKLMLALINNEALVLRIIRLAIQIDLRLGARLVGELSCSLQNRAIEIINGLEIPKKLKTQLFGLTKSLSAISYLSQSLFDANSYIRYESINAIAKIDSDESRNLLKKALCDLDKNNRLEAAFKLALLNDKAAVSVLENALYDEKHHLKAMTSLVKLAPDQILILLEAIFCKGNSKIRLCATNSLLFLYKQGFDKVIPLLEIALCDESDNIRCLAAQILGDIKSEEALEILSRAWADEYELVQTIICNSPGNNVNRFLGEKLQEVLLGNCSILIKRAISVVIKTRLATKEIIDALINIVFFHSDFLIRNKATTALVMTEDTYTITALSRILQDEDFQVRHYEHSHSIALCILYQIRSIESIPILTKYLVDQSKTIVARSLAIKALGEIGDSSIIQVLLNSLNLINLHNNYFESELIYRNTILALGKLGFEYLEYEIISIMRHSESLDIRKEAVEALGKIPTKKAKAGLIDALEDPDFSVRFSSSIVLAKQLYVDSIPVLIEALGFRNCIGFKDSVICESAISALCELGEASIEQLECALDHQDLQVRKNASLAIDRIRSNTINNRGQSDIDFNQENNDYIDTIINKFANKYSYTELIKKLSTADPGQVWEFSLYLTKISRPEQLGFLNDCLLEAGSNNFYSSIPGIICSIQNDCKFYNYEIRHE